MKDISRNSGNFELKIRELLNEFEDTTRVADHLIRQWDLGELSWQEQHVASKYLLSAGFQASLFSQIRKSIIQKQKVPWGIVLAALASLKVDLNKKDFDSILIGAGEESALTDLVDCYAFDEKEPRIRNIRDKIYSSIGNVDKAEKLKNDSFQVLKRRAEAEDAPTKKETERVGKFLIQKAKKEKAMAYEIAVTLHLMGLSEASFSALQYAADNPAAQWMRLELLIENKRFVDAVELATELEEKSEDDTDAILSALYAKAIALEGLGKKKQAIEILQTILNTKPSYRSAHTLLLQWNEQ